MLYPIKDRVVVEQDKPDEKTKSGIILTTQSQEEKPRGTVIAAGKGCETVKAGDRILFNPKWKMDFRDDGKDYVIINEPDIIAVLHA